MALAALPTVDELRSAPLVHRYGDLFAPPGLTNFLGACQVDVDPIALRSITFPPFSTFNETITARAYLNGRLIDSYGAATTFVWQPDRIERSVAVDGLDLTTTTVMAPGVLGVVIDMVLSNPGDQDRAVPLSLRLASSLTQAVRAWNTPEPPGEVRNAVLLDAERAAVTYSAQGSAAIGIQGVDDPSAVVDGECITMTAHIPAGGRWRVGFVYAVGETLGEAQQTYDKLVVDVPYVISLNELVWNDELQSMFTPGNDRFAGSLPLLETDNAALRRLYVMGALGVLYFRRDSPHSVLGRAYDTLMPRYWQSVTFIWDYNLSSLVHALLDRGVMRRQLEHWMATDVHTHFGTNWLTGSTVGNWYSVNDFAMTRMIRDYVAWTGDSEWLLTRVPGTERTVIDYVDEYATAWRRLRGEHGLADYGGINNLLECVSTYVHAVASLNAANVFTLRAAADMHELLGSERAAVYRAEADQIVAAVQDLYVEGEGFWQARHPDGRLVPVRHCYDFFTVPFGMLADLSEQQRAEMAEFFVRELQTPTWMHALSPRDADAVFSVRPDHQWNGAYPAWPAESAAALFRMGHDEIAAAWLPGLAASSNQGPFGQAHFVETAVPPDTGGARKAPPELPWINDWTCSSNGAWVSLVIEAVFGVSVGWDGHVSATPRLTHVDPHARLTDLVVAGRVYDIDAAGVHPRDL